MITKKVRDTVDLIFNELSSKLSVEQSKKMGEIYANLDIVDKLHEETNTQLHNTQKAYAETIKHGVMSTTPPKEDVIKTVTLEEVAKQVLKKGN